MVNFTQKLTVFPKGWKDLEIPKESKYKSAVKSTEIFQESKENTGCLGFCNAMLGLESVGEREVAIS